jgi:hypothetical protein
MKIVDARWTKKINMLVILCACNKTFEHRADRWAVKCPTCSRVAHLHDLREQYSDKGNDDG